MTTMEQGPADSGTVRERGPAGTLAELGRLRDWASTPVGSPDAWPDKLRTIASMALASPAPMAVLWGRDAVLIYNDAYAAVIEPRRPDALGRPAGEIFDVLVKPALERLQRCAQALAPGNAGWDVSIAPIRDDTGKLEGALAILTHNPSATAFMLRLADALQFLDDPVEIQATAARLVANELRANRVLCADMTGDDEPTIAYDFVEGLQSIPGRRAIDLLGCDATGRTLVVNDAASDPALTEPERRDLRDAGVASCIAVSEVEQHRSKAAFHVHSATPRTWSASEIALVENVARRVWTALRRARAGQIVRASLAEHEALTRDIHHRVRNNFQLLASLVNLQANQIDDPRVQSLFEATRARIHSIAAIYGLISRLRAASRLDLVQFVRELVPELVRIHGGEDAIQVAIEGGDATLEVERAVPFGLLLNELCSNACKHAFPVGTNPGELTLRFGREDNDNVVIVADNGIGLAPGLHRVEARSLSFQLVHMLAAQLGGTVHVATRDGVRVELRFPSTR